MEVSSEVQEWLCSIASDVSRNRLYLEKKSDLNYDELGLDTLGGCFLFMFYTAVDEQIIHGVQTSEFGIAPKIFNISEMSELSDDDRLTFVVSASSCAKVLKANKINPIDESAAPEENALLQLSRAFIYLYRIYYKQIDTKIN